MAWISFCPLGSIPKYDESPSYRKIIYSISDQAENTFFDFVIEKYKIYISKSQYFNKILSTFVINRK